MYPGVTPFGEHGALPFSPTLLLFSESRTSSVSKIGKLTNGETKPSAETGGVGVGGVGKHQYKHGHPEEAIDKTPSISTNRWENRTSFPTLALLSL